MNFIAYHEFTEAINVFDSRMRGIINANLVQAPHHGNLNTHKRTHDGNDVSKSKKQKIAKS